jgi:5-methyltetrahydrofolate--homocysteine methyltransferase
MVVTASDLRDAGIALPMLVGGAALSGRFTRGKIAPAYGGTVAYAGDAMSGLDLLNRLMDPALRAQLEAGLLEKDLDARPAAPVVTADESEQRSPKVSLNVAIPSVPDTDRHLVEVADLDEIWSYINPQMLYGRHMGLRGRFSELIASGDARALELEEKIERVKQDCRAGQMRVRVVWQFFEAEPDGNQIRFFEGRGSSAPVETFTFPRQRKAGGLALSDFVLPPEIDATGRALKRDHVALFVTSAGEGIRELAEEAKERGEYLKSYALQALALETAEAAAEWIHSKLRALWGFPDQPGLSRQALFQARYRGKRYSFGYPACPDLEQQEGLFRLLQPEDMGVELTEGFMMEPEASVSALVFHHPEATYFSAAAVEMVEAGAD